MYELTLSLQGNGVCLINVITKLPGFKTKFVLHQRKFS